MVELMMEPLSAFVEKTRQDVIEELSRLEELIDIPARQVKREIEKRG